MDTGWQCPQWGCKDGKFDIFDSASPHLNGALQRQIAVLLCTKRDIVRVWYVLILFAGLIFYITWLCRYKQCQRQAGSIDCGLFAVAFAAVLAEGAHPSGYLFNLKLMRSHCTFTLVYQMKFGFHVYCNCRMPASFSDEMIQCGKCGKWYHLEICVRVEDLGVDWHCDSC